MQVSYQSWIVNLTNSILQFWGGTLHHPELKQLPTSFLQNYNNVILLVIDALWYEYLSKQKNSFLQKHLKSSISSNFPSSTTASIPTFLTGLTPYEHGLVWRNIYFRKLGSIIHPLPSIDKLSKNNVNKYQDNYEALYQSIPLFEQMPKTQNFIINPAAYQASSFNQHFNSGASCLWYQSFEDLSFYVQQASYSGDHKKYIYAYRPYFDEIAHHTGINSQDSKQHFDYLDQEISKLWARLNQDTLLIITSDHGMIDSNKERFIPLYEDKIFLDWLLIPPTWEKRFVYCHIDPEKSSSWLHHMQTKYTNSIDIFASKELLEKNFFWIGSMHEDLPYRVGNFTLIAKSNYILETDIYKQSKKRHIGEHGWLSSQETKCPLILIS